jgi:hypothetical protein
VYFSNLLEKMDADLVQMSTQAQESQVDKKLEVWDWIILYCIVLYCIALYCIALYLCCIVLYCAFICLFIYFISSISFVFLFCSVEAHSVRNKSVWR